MLTFHKIAVNKQQCDRKRNLRSHENVKEYLLFLRDQCESKFAFAAELASDFKFGAAKIQRASLLYQPRRDFARITRLYRILESDLVKSGIQCKMTRNIVLYKYGAALSHDLARA